MVEPNESGIGRITDAVSLPVGSSGLVRRLVIKVKGKVKEYNKVSYSQLSYASTVKEGSI